VTTIEAEIAPGFFGAVAAETGIFQDGFDVAREINLDRGRRREFGFVRVRGKRGEAKEQRQEAQASVADYELASIHGIRRPDSGAWIYFIFQ